MRILGLIPKEDQLQLLRLCSVVVQPSLFEGWSTVVEEAVALGKRLVLSDLPVHREQSPPFAEYFEPTSVDSLIRCLSRKELWASDWNPDAEKESIVRYRKKFQEFGTQFLEIAGVLSGA